MSVCHHGEAHCTRTECRHAAEIAALQKRITYLEAWQREAKLALQDIVDNGEICHDDPECPEDRDCRCTNVMRVNQLFEDSKHDRQDP